VWLNRDFLCKYFSGVYILTDAKAATAIAAAALSTK